MHIIKLARTCRVLIAAPKILKKTMRYMVGEPTKALQSSCCFGKFLAALADSNRMWLSSSPGASLQGSNDCLYCSSLFSPTWPLPHSTGLVEHNFMVSHCYQPVKSPSSAERIKRLPGRSCLKICAKTIHANQVPNTAMAPVWHLETQAFRASTICCGDIVVGASGKSADCQVGFWKDTPDFSKKKREDHGRVSILTH